MWSCCRLNFYFTRASFQPILIWVALQINYVSMHEYILVDISIGREVSKNKIVENLGTGLCDFMMMETMQQFRHSCTKVWCVVEQSLLIIFHVHELLVLDRRSSVWALYLWTSLRWAHEGDRINSFKWQSNLLEALNWNQLIDIHKDMCLNSC